MKRGKGQRNQPRSPQPSASKPSAETPSVKVPSVKVNVWVSPHRRPPPTAPHPTDESPPPEAIAPFPPSPDANVVSPVKSSLVKSLPVKSSPVNILVAARPAPKTAASRLFLAALWLGMAVAVFGGGWAAFSLILNPGSVPWLSELMPEWQRRSLDQGNSPKTLAEIRQIAARNGLVVGDPLALDLSAPAETGDLVLPVFAQRPGCTEAATSPLSSSHPCRQIAELRIYRPHPRSLRKPLLELVDRVAVSGSAENFVVAPLVNSTTDSLGSSQPLPFTSLSRMGGTPPTPEGTWLQISGVWKRGNTPLTHGQVVYYDPFQSRLRLLTRWTSPAGQLAQWQQVTGGPSGELVINQTIGLEPAFQVYRLKRQADPINPMQLKEIALAGPARSGKTYQQAIALTQVGLWTPALTLLQSVKAQIPAADWSVDAQAQLDVIALHAQVTKAQAERTWSSRSQAIAAQLLDGRWSAALQSLEAASRDGQDLSGLVRDPSGRLWRRIQAGLQVSPNQADIQAWGTLVVAARQGRTVAIAWLQGQLQRAAPRSGQRPPTIANLDSHLQRSLGLLDQIAGDDAIAHPSSLIGSVDRLSRVTASDWLRRSPSDALELEAGQAWYRIQVSRFHDGQRWQRSPFNALNLPSFDLSHQLWSLLGFGRDPQLQIVVWPAGQPPQTISATVKGVRLSGGNLQILAIAPAVDLATVSGLPRPLAITANTLPWVEPANSLTLSDLHGQQPDWAAALLPIIWQQAQGQTAPATSNPATSNPSATLLSTIGAWPVQLLDLTGNGQPEAIVTLQPSAAPQSSLQPSLQPSRFGTLIFADNGRLIYSSLNQAADQRFVGLISISDSRSPALLINTAQTYSLLRWSEPQQRFE